MEKKKYEYVIFVDEKEVWRGQNPKEKFDEIRQKNPNKKVAIAWESGGDVIIARKVV